MILKIRVCYRMSCPVVKRDVLSIDVEIRKIYLKRNDRPCGVTLTRLDPLLLSDTSGIGDG